MDKLVDRWVSPVVVWNLIILRKISDRTRCAQDLVTWLACGLVGVVFRASTGLISEPMGFGASCPFTPFLY